jgi:hypothetical protein
MDGLVFKQRLRCSLVFERFRDHPTLESGSQVLLGKRLGEVIIHPSCQALVPIAFHGIGRQGNDGNMVTGADRSFMPANGGRCGEPVQYRHLAVHEYEIIAFPQYGLNSLSAILGQVNVVTQKL